MSSELGPAHWAGREIQQRDYFYFYKGLNETLEQERAQLKELEHVTSPSLLKFGVGTKFGGTMGAKWQMKPEHLIELALEVDRINIIMADIELDENGEPDPDHPDGMALIAPELEYLYLLFSVMTFRSFNEPTLRKWMQAPEEMKEEDRGSILTKLLGDSSDVSSE